MSTPDTSPSAYNDRPQATTGMPPGIPYIIGNEAAERFSFYGMKAILTVFMVDYLHWMSSAATNQGMSNAEATEHYHTFTAAAYFFPVIGALLSDIFLGKYRTILYLSIVYCIGHGALALMGSPPMSAGMWLFAGLLLISIGSGGIKPCVSAHVGDQFGKSNSHMLTKVYQWFYFSINFGSFISTLLTPWVLEHYGPHWAFGIPGVLMAIATLLFWMGRHKFVHIRPGGYRFLQELLSWEKFSSIPKLMIIFSFVAVFWALFDQTGSSWVLQAKNLNREWLGYTWLESQIQAINPILVLTLIPLFQFLIYPAIDRVFPLTPIRKISLGLFVMIGGFAIVALLQERVDAGSQPSIGWQFLAYAVLTASEVMVSITCLEFAYTQAPKTMKSIVMAVFLFSVSMGNVFTATVNRYIQTPAAASLAADIDLEEDAKEPMDNGSFVGELKLDDPAAPKLTLLGPDNTLGTPDDATLLLNEEGKLDSIENASLTSFNAVAEKIEAYFLDQTGDDSTRAFPSVEEAQPLVAGAEDAFGNPITYKLLSRDQYQLVSAGADGENDTQWDETLTGTVDRANTSDTVNTDAPTFNWLERQKIAIESEGDPNKAETVKSKLISERGGGDETKLSRDYAIGGRTLLEGAAYFWFWTTCIFVTAILFVPVGYLYKEKTYIQDEEDAEHEAEALADEAIST
ncbi:POT family MFS transporter [Rhodopirellula baltica]|uniref:Amino acid/peptide transporter n=1 Tax=Rhodopirellula baltica WH47 TaxID=991778 RepID=F2ANV4_RHOBT|nr:POT family MFS transporter [Rhodopirellula baltica]EGF28622.1 amino acid/peptide transporter [Rhodopirellula baltica WH47]